MTLSRRVLIQWQGEPEGEPTSTYVSSSSGHHFVDIRINSAFYPLSEGARQEPFHIVFDWVLAGKEEPVKDTNQIQFNLEIDSLEIAESIDSRKPLEECRHAPELGFFEAICGTEDRREKGCMPNPATGQKQDYIEVWRSLDSDKHTPKAEVREDPISVPTTMYVLKADLGRYEGKCVRLGSWFQGLVHDKSNHEMHVVRAWHDGTSWRRLIQYGGPNLFPLDFSARVGGVCKAEGCLWRCIE